MFNVPLTFVTDDQLYLDDRFWPFFFHEFAVAGAKHLVLAAGMLERCMKQPTFLRDLQRVAAEEGLDFVDAHSVFEREKDMVCPDPDLIPLMIGAHKYCMDVCAALGVKTICIHVGNNVWRDTSAAQNPYFFVPNCEIEKCIARTEAALAELLPYAEKLGITICIENTWHETNTTERLLAYKKKFPTEALGFCYDAGHANLMKEDRGLDSCAPKNAWLPVGKPVPWNNHVLEDMLDDVVICHLHNNDGQWDQHRRVDRGTVDWGHILPLLHKAPRLKSIQCEAFCLKGRTAVSEMVQSFFETIQ